MSAVKFRAGQIVLADWRGDGLPKEPNKRRPAVVVEDEGLFAELYPNTIVVPLTEDADIVIADLAVEILPDERNGCRKPCWAVSHLVTSASKKRLTGTESHLTAEQVTRIRQQIALAIAVE